MIHEIVQFQDIDFLHVDPLILVYFQFHVDHVKIRVLGTSIRVVNSNGPLSSSIYT